MALHLKETFAKAKLENRPVFVSYVTCGFPEVSDTIPTLLALEKGGADIIEVGIPFSDPIADGPTIQDSSFIALQNGVNLEKSLEIIKEARVQGLSVPIVLMGYYNPFLIYGEQKLMKDCKEVNVNGFIVVDLPPEESVRFRDLCHDYGLSYIPLIAPSTTESRMKKLVSVADSFIYVISTMGVTGTRDSVSANLPKLLSNIQKHTQVPLAVGFGVATREQFVNVARHAEGVVIGSKIIQILKMSEKEDRAANVFKFAQEVTHKNGDPSVERESISNEKTNASEVPAQVHLSSRFGNFGGQYAPEALVDCLDEIEQAFKVAKEDPLFWEEFESHYDFIGRPSPLHQATRLTLQCKGARIWLKREDLNHTGSHKINNALGQVLLARRIGKKRIIAETGAGQHGVATATVCAKFGMECVIYMGAEDVRRQALNVFRIRLLGAKVIPVESGSKTLKDAINEAMRDWVTNVDTTHYLIGSAIGPHPFPTLVREFQSVIGKETKLQMQAKMNKLPDAVIACVGGGSNAIGMFYPFIKDESVKMIGVEAAGEGIESGKHAATLSAGSPGVLHGTKTYLIQDKNGQIIETHSISAGLDYPGVGPEHAFLMESGRVVYTSATDAEALKGMRLLSEMEGIIPALETAHAVYKAMEIASKMTADEDVVICLSGRGDKDVVTVAQSLPHFGPLIGWDLRFSGEANGMSPLEH